MFTGPPLVASFLPHSDRRERGHYRHFRAVHYSDIGGRPRTAARQQLESCSRISNQPGSVRRYRGDLTAVGPCPAHGGGTLARLMTSQKKAQLVLKSWLGKDVVTEHVNAHPSSHAVDRSHRPCPCRGRCFDGP